jgi:hypothetical protein
VIIANRASRSPAWSRPTKLRALPLARERPSHSRVAGAPLPARLCATLGRGDRRCHRRRKTFVGVIYLDACVVMYSPKSTPARADRWPTRSSGWDKRALPFHRWFSANVSWRRSNVAIRSWSAPIPSCSGFSCRWPCPSRCTCKQHCCVPAFLFGRPTPSIWLALSTIAARRCGRMTTDWLRPRTDWRATSWDNHHGLPPGRYACELIKEDSGRWRFSRRTVLHDHDYTLDGIGR